MKHTKITLDQPPLPFGDFEHHEVEEGRHLQIVAMDIDERHRRLQLHLR